LPSSGSLSLMRLIVLSADSWKAASSSRMGKCKGLIFTPLACRRVRRAVARSLISGSPCQTTQLISPARKEANRVNNGVVPNCL